MDYLKLEKQLHSWRAPGAKPHIHEGVRVPHKCLSSLSKDLTYVLKSKAGGYVASIHETLAIARSRVGGATQV